MGHKVRVAAVSGAVLILLAILGRGLMVDPNFVPSALVGQPAPAFVVPVISQATTPSSGETSPSADRDRLSLGAFAGKVVILNFWASWCIACRDEAHELEAFWQEHRNDGVVVLGIAIQDTPENAQAFAQALGKTYTIGLDTTGSVSIDYGVHGVPETFVIDAAGTIRHKEVGPVTRSMLKSLLAQVR